MKILAFLLSFSLLLAGCKKDNDKQPEESPEKIFLPQTITISNHIVPDLNGTVHLEYNPDRQITRIRTVTKSGSYESVLTYTYDGQKRLIRTNSGEKPVSASSYTFQNEYNYEYTSDAPSKLTLISSDNSGASETLTDNITRPNPDRFYLWGTNLSFTPDGDLSSGAGSIYDGWGVSATYGTGTGVFAHVQKQPAHSFFLNRHPVAGLLFLAKKELQTLKINAHESNAFGGDYNAITVQRDAQNRISRYVIKNDTKTYAHYEIEYLVPQDK